MFDSPSPTDRRASLVNIWRWDRARREASKIAGSTWYDDFPPGALGGDQPELVSGRPLDLFPLGSGGPGADLEGAGRRRDADPRDDRRGAAGIPLARRRAPVFCSERGCSRSLVDAGGWWTRDAHPSRRARRLLGRRGLRDLLPRPWA